MMIAKRQTLHTKSIAGFTLVEMIVAIGIFTIVMLIATSAIFTIVAANRKAQSLKLVMDNLDFALQSMVREIRVGSDYCESQVSCSTTGSSSFEFTSSDSGQPTILYFLSDGKIEEGNSSWNSGNDVPITASDIDITSLNFYLVPASATTQARVLITIQGTAGDSTDLSQFNIQTTVSERKLDLSGSGS